MKAVRTTKAVKTCAILSASELKALDNEAHADMCDRLDDLFGAVRGFIFEDEDGDYPRALREALERFDAAVRERRLAYAAAKAQPDDEAAAARDQALGGQIFDVEGALIEAIDDFMVGDFLRPRFLETAHGKYVAAEDRFVEAAEKAEAAGA